MRLRSTALLLALGLSTGVNAQQLKKGKPGETLSVPDKRTCGTIDHHEYLKQTRPGYEKSFIDYNKMIEEYMSNPSVMKNATPNSVITIPVVIHVVYKTAGENISDAQAQSQFQVLNDDFQRHNADTTIGSAFYSVAGRVNFQFCLAQRDPNGNATTGIVHKQTTKASFGTNDDVKSSATGGDDPWDVTKYVNIWVCNLGTQLLGYGEFPTNQISQTWGLVLNYTCTGTTGTATAPYNKGRTGTHEFGHCFNLYHIWGDDGTGCTGSDQCSDTPNQAGENYGCPSLPHTDACSPSAPGVMCMNYMDYTDDACMSMFTAQQCARMLAVVSNAPWNVLQSSNGCLPVNLANNDAGISMVNAPSGSGCAGSFVPKVTIKNYGANNLTSCTINYKVDAGSVSTYNWTGNLASLATQQVTLPAITVTAGTHTFTSYTSNPNGSADATASNDQSSGSFTAVASVAGTALPYSYGFEGTFPVSGVTIANPDAGTTWVQTTGSNIHVGGTKSVTIDNYNYNAAGEKDDIVLPNLDLTGTGTPTLTFQVAYQLYTDPAAAQHFSDTLEVLLSTDCGSTFNSVYKKFGTTTPSTSLTTTTPAFSTAAFTPTSSQWRMETVNLASYENSNNVQIKFRNITQYENNLYLDDINISNVVSVKDIMAKSERVDLWPNPNNGSFSLNFNNITPDQMVTVTVYNAIGEVIKKPISAKGINGVYNMDLTDLASGVYQIEIRTENNVTVKKVVINK